MRSQRGFGVERPDQEALFETPLLAYLHPGRFSRIRETFAFPFVEAEED